MAKLGRPRIYFAPEDLMLPWRDEAACHDAVQEDPTLGGAWIQEHGEHAQTARSICSSCPVRYQCALEALGDPETEGIRAGYGFERGALNYRDRAAMAREFGFVARERKMTGSYR